MSADLAVYQSNPAELDALTRESVVALLERGKTWLTMAVARDAEVGDFVEFKGQAETVRVYTVQKQLGKDAELAAAELVRRAERGIGKAIRKGQEAGEIASRRTSPGPSRDYVRDGRLVHVGDRVRDSNPISPADYFAHGTDQHQTYAVTDDVTDEQFDDAITEAKTEGNLSRANVVRKVTGRVAPKGRRPEVLRKTRHIDSHRVVAATVDGYADNAIPRDLFAEIDLGELETQDLREWISSLSESARALRSLRTTLEKELSQRG